MELGRPRCDDAKVGFEERKKIEKVREMGYRKVRERKRKERLLICGYIGFKN